MSLLTVRDVSHIYFSKDAKTAALLDISFSVREQEFVSLVGPSGCGKTTLLSIMAGLMEPTVGKVTLEDEKVHPKSRKIGYMLQQDYLFPWKTVEENILIGLKLTRQLNEETRRKTLSLLHEIGLRGVEKQYPAQLSGGMRQRAALVRTLATDPKILLLDEPFSALDFQTKLKMEELVYRTLKHYRKTALLVTHDIGEAIAMSDRVILLSNRPGTVRKIFAIPEEIRALPPFLARQHPDFQRLFDMIWKELENLESSEQRTPS
ncbi:MAG: spermidine/putrescine ABC transporter ATP-binding protein [Caldibacillus debilis]|uniref:ABC transporter ATP-binding protein n=1 Tax=Caldibacillus debilis TaxID=301148 RepID=UPI000B55B8B4|nr:ABC transporter ATP-binding protein [Caldibacillus debilis]OUM84901.1 MAG: spermidine/putrescine ABC transporter ATP-binding protein [Caldibacillus debilis]REJ18322.1 MAG: spermidine/putrescine ABC transporter ATP-binding protein [Caldibacillus debilis]